MSRYSAQQSSISENNRSRILQYLYHNGICSRAQIAKAIKLSQKCMGIVYQNIVFAIGVKVLCLALGALGIANMWLAIFADVGVMILAVLNAIRALFVKNL